VVDVDDGAPGDEAGGDDTQALVQLGELGAGADAAPDLAAQGGEHGLGGAGVEDAAASDDGEAGAQLGDVLDDVGAEDDDHVLADLAEQVEEAVALGRVEAGGGLVDDDEAGAAEQGDGDAEALLHAAGEAADGLLADRGEVGLLEQGGDLGAALAADGDALQDREVLEDGLGGEVGVEAELLREVAELAAELGLLFEHVDVAEADAAAVGVLQGGDRAHERRLAGAVGAEQAEHAGGDREVDALQRAHAVGVGLGELADLQFHGDGRETVTIDPNTGDLVSARRRDHITSESS
jgi:hypothetical protein